jgi:hypothetical protein
MPIYSLKARLFRIKQANGLNLSTALTTSPSRFTYSAALFVFHQISRPAGPGKQATKDDGLPHGYSAKQGESLSKNAETPDAVSNSFFALNLERFS